MHVHLKGCRSKWVCILICSVFILWAGPISRAAAQEDKEVTFGLGAGGGFEASFIHHKPKLTVFSVFPRADFHFIKRLTLEAEGNFSHYDVKKEKDLTFVGLNGNVIYTPFEWKWGSFFLLFGGGLGYDDNKDKDVKKVGHSHFCGILQGGGGFTLNLAKSWGLRAEYRLYHISEPLIADGGLNAHTFVVGIFF